MHIEIHLPRPGVALLAIAAVSGWGMYWSSGTEAETAAVIEAPPIHAPTAPAVEQAAPERAQGEIPTAAFGDSGQDNTEEGDDTRLTQTEMRVKWARAEQDFLRQRQDIIRDQLQGLQKERDALGPNIDPDLEEQFRRSVQLLTSLVRDQQKSEQFLRASYRQGWQAEEDAMAAAAGVPEKHVSLFWPVEPTIGISAYFLDPGYKERFKVDHYAIDVPVPQGTDVLAAADGIVKDVVDHGLGYSYVTITHGNMQNGVPKGTAAVYGHLSEISVRPGQRVKAGDVVGKSGGMPGLKGGGSSTGPHLHFGLYINGVPVDPLQYLPKYQG